MIYSRRKRWGGTLAQKRKERFIVYSGLIVLAFLLVLVALVFISRISKFQIVDISVAGNSITSSREIESVVGQNISGFYLNLFSKRNTFIYPIKRIERDMLDSFKRIESVKISTDDFNTLNIKVHERSPDAMWCGLEPTTDPKGCYFVDSKGFIYSLAPQFSGNVFFKNFGEIKNVKSPVGQSFLPLSKYQNLIFFRNSLEDEGLTPIISNKVSKDDVEIFLEEGGKIIYGLDQDITRISEDLSSILKDPSFKELFFDSAKELDYIDLRFKNKAFFKFK